MYLKFFGKWGGHRTRNNAVFLRIKYWYEQLPYLLIVFPRNKTKVTYISKTYRLIILECADKCLHFRKGFCKGSSTDIVKEVNILFEF